MSHFTDSEQAAVVCHLMAMFTDGSRLLAHVGDDDPMELIDAFAGTYARIIAVRLLLEQAQRRHGPRFICEAPDQMM